MHYLGSRYISNLTMERNRNSSDEDRHSGAISVAGGGDNSGQRANMPVTGDNLLLQKILAQVHERIYKLEVPR